MCMICKGLERGKFSPEEARIKLEEFVDLDLLDEEHQEEVETLIANIEEEEFYWASTKRNIRRLEDEEEETLLDEEDTMPDEDPYEEES